MADGRAYRLAEDDDHLLHQTLEPFDCLWTEDPRAYERYWFGLHDKSGRLRMVQGAGFYPNLGTCDAFSIVVLDGRHISIRVSKSFQGNRADLRFGPIGAEVIRGLNSWRLTLDRNEWGIAYDLVWTDTKTPQFHQVGPTYHADKLLKVMAGFETFGTCRGWIEVEGEHFEVTAETFLGSRDRHWGARNGIGGPEYVVRKGPRISLPKYFPGQWVEFDDFAVWGDQILYNPGDSRTPETIVDFERHLRFDEETKLFIGGSVLNRLSDGRELELEFDRLGNQIAFLRCGGYGGPNGGTPEANVWSGMYVGEHVVEGEMYDLNVPEVQTKLAGLDQHHCRVTYGDEVSYGLLEAYEPETYELCVEGAPSFALAE